MGRTMSITSKWLALSVDWMDSEMFDDSSVGARLAWICLLCHVKAVGRAGKAKVRAKSFSRKYNVSVRSVEEMLKTAQKFGALSIDGDVVTLCNWKVYNDKQRNSGISKMQENRETLQTPKNSPPLTTNHKPLTTNHKTLKPAKRL